MMGHVSSIWTLFVYVRFFGWTVGNHTTFFISLHNLTFKMPSQTFDKRRLVGIQPERVTNVSNTEYPGHYPDEDHSWNLEHFKKVRRLVEKNPLFFLKKRFAKGRN